MSAEPVVSTSWSWNTSQARASISSSSILEGDRSGSLMRPDTF